MRNMLKTLMTAATEYIPLKRELLGMEPEIFLSVAAKCGFEAIRMEDETNDRVLLKRLGIPRVKLYDFNESNEFCWLNISDLHIGHPDFDEEALFKTLGTYYEKVKNCKHKYVFIAGDAFESIREEGLSYELARDNPIFKKKIRKEYQAQCAKLCWILSKFPLDYIALNGNHEYMFVQLGLQSPLANIEDKLRSAGINYKFYDTYMMDFIIAGIVIRIMHLEGHHYKEGRNPIYERINQFKAEKQLAVFVGGKRYPVRFIQSGHRHKRQILYDPTTKIHVIEAGSFIKGEMSDGEYAWYLQGKVDANGFVTLL